jgi:hypothetical protein
MHTSQSNKLFKKIERRLASWKRMYLSKGGRVTLIKGILSNLSMYFMSLWVLQTILRRSKDFLWEKELGVEMKSFQLDVVIELQI